MPAARNPLADVPPDRFVQARDALVRQLRERGDSEGARRIAALRRPSTILWIANQLGHRARKAMDELIESTARARRAQVHGASGDELRDAMRAQREATQRLLAEAEQAAADAGLALTLEQQRRIKDTLQAAATSDPEGLRQGAMEHELSPSGFGALLSNATAAVPAVVAKAATKKRDFESRAEERKRKMQEQKQKVAENRERHLRQRELRQAEQAARRLTARAAQLEQHAQRTMAAAQQAKEQADAARREANATEARLLQLRETRGHNPH
ncbi:MAG TPA: hypothetical protein VEP66_09085 [Myxococcales bacterium]|nr:hypothetical protein [Myxococcales bacterium]